MTKRGAHKAQVHVEIGLSYEPVTIRQIGARLNLDHTTIYSALRELEMQKLVKRTQINPSVGGRSKHVMFAWEIV